LSRHRVFQRALILGRLSLIAAIPYGQCTVEEVQGRSRAVYESATAVYEGGVSKAKELATFWGNPAERIKEYVLKERNR
jgi:hypothetical protein